LSRVIFAEWILGSLEEIKNTYERFRFYCHSWYWL